MELLDLIGWALIATGTAASWFGQYDIWKVRTSPDYWAQGKKWWHAWFFTFDSDSMVQAGEHRLDRGFLMTVGGLLLGMVCLLVLYRDDWTVGWF